MAEEILKAAEEHFRSLTEAERRMLLAEKSTRAICGNDDCDSNPANNPECGELRCETRSIRADLIAWLCKNAGAYGRSASDGIHVYGARITGVLDLSYEDVRLPLSFMCCYFNDEIWLKNAKILSLNLTGSRTHRIMADGLQTANHIFFGDGFHAKGEVLFRDATIGGSFNAVGATFEYEPSERSRANSFNSLGCDRIKIDGSMFLRRSSFKGEVGLSGAYIGSNLEFDGSTLENPFAAQDGSRFALRADRITVSGSVFLRSQFLSGGVQLFSHIPATLKIRKVVG